jgi:GT2 family glycosyltransferase
MPKPLLSIIIVSFNTKQLTLDCLNSIYAQTDDKKILFETVILDNASTDGSLGALQAFAKDHPSTMVIEKKQNTGFGKGNNEAVKHASGKYLLLLNTDIVVLDHDIEKLFDFYRKNEEKVQFLGGKLLNKDLSPQPSAAPFYTLPVVFLALFMRGDYWGATRSSPAKTTETGWVSGACVLTTKDYYQALNGFDEHIFMYMDEVDLLYRAKKQGWRTYFYPEARFIHLGSASSASSNKRTAPILQVYRGFLFFYKKHYGAGALFLLKIMLKLKAVIGIVIGRIFKNNYLITTYEEAFKLVKMD